MKVSKYNYEISIFVVQIAVVVILIVAIFIVKFINIDWFNTVRGFYIGNFTLDTNADEVLSDEEAVNENTVQVMSLAQSYANRPAQKLLINPLKNITITSAYGWRNSPIDGKREFHKGIDLSGETGDEIYATADGEVILSQHSYSYGNYIIIKHANGIETLYAHCEKLYKEVGESVSAGENIASVGSTGRSTAPHLHYEIIINGQNVNPEWLVSK